MLKSRVLRYLVTLAAGLIVVVAATWAVGEATTIAAVARLSHQLYGYATDHRIPSANHTMNTLTDIGSYATTGTFAVLVGAILAYQRRRWYPFLLLGGGWLLVIVGQRVIGYLISVPKPPVAHAIGPVGGFPSGGSARVVVAFGLCAWVLGRREWTGRGERRALWAVVVLLALIEGCSRLYLGRHWPADIVAGWIYGAMLVSALVLPLRPRPRPAPDGRTALIGSGASSGAL